MYACYVIVELAQSPIKPEIFMARIYACVPCPAKTSAGSTNLEFKCPARVAYVRNVILDLA